VDAGTPDSATGTAVPRRRLDALMAELQTRVEAVRACRERVQGLLEAVLVAGRDVDLREVLRHVVEAAVTLADARYGALGVVGEGGALAEFVTVGLSDSEVEATGGSPHGRGILGELTRRREPLRLAEVRADPASYGFPPNHPAMTTFLGVPVVVRSEVYGNLYVTEKRGGAEFDDEDEQLLATLAAAAGVAIDNARLRDAAGRDGHDGAGVRADTARIARLQERAVQSLFAAGTTLEEASRLVGDPDVATRLVRAADDLDTAIDVIRTTIAALQASATDLTGR